MGTNYSPKPVTNGLVFYLDAGNVKSYPASGVTWTDLTLNVNNGTLTNGPTFNSANYGSIIFDGTNDFVDCGNSSSLSITTGTVCAWFKKTTGSGYKGLVDKGRDDYGAWSLNVDETNGRITFKSRIAGVNRLITASTSYTSNTWTYACGVFTGTSLMVYQNGALSNSISYTGSIGVNTVSVRVGSANDGLFFNGNIGCASIYNRPLSAAEIKQNFNAIRSRYGI